MAHLSKTEPTESIQIEIVDGGVKLNVDSVWGTSSR